MSNLEKLMKNQELISKELSALKAEVADLEILVNKSKNTSCNRSYQSLNEANVLLEKKIDLTKQELIRLEIARGVPQIALLKPNDIKTDSLVQCVPKTIDNKNTVIESKKEKSEKRENKDTKKAKPAPVPEGPVDVSRLDFRVGKIVDVKKHPDADSLYVEQVDVGKEQPITVVSGLVKHVPIEDMKDRMVVLLCNLKAAKMRGITSQAMVMCASTPEKVEILIPPEGSIPGDIVSVDGFPPNPDAELNPKKKIFETVAPDLKTDSNLQATYKGNVWSVPGKGPVKTASLVAVNIK